MRALDRVLRWRLDWIPNLHAQGHNVAWWGQCSACRPPSPITASRGTALVVRRIQGQGGRAGLTAPYRRFRTTGPLNGSLHPPTSAPDDPDPCSASWPCPFVVIQFAPGGPVEQIVAGLQGQGGGAADRLAAAGATRRRRAATRRAIAGAQDWTPRFIQRLNEQFRFRQAGLAALRAEMIWNYARFDFARASSPTPPSSTSSSRSCRSRSRSASGSRSCPTRISIPLGIRKALHEASRFDTRTSAVIIVAYAIPASCSRCS